MGDWSPKHPLPSTHQNPTHSEGKHMCSTNQCLHKGSRHRKPPSSVREQQEHANPKVPDASLGPTLQAGFAEDSSLQPAVLTHFCTDILSCLPIVQPPLFCGKYCYREISGQTCFSLLNICLKEKQVSFKLGQWTYVWPIHTEINYITSDVHSWLGNTAKKN